MSGKVYLVGAGPGDPELLTLKALRVLQEADVVLHDDLVTPEILACVPRTARVYSVGKRCGRKKITQEEINAHMVDCASDGLIVVRLKGGDPLIFSRAGEEMDALGAAGVDFEVIPGVTAASAAAAAARIPLTDRRLASQLLFLTGHRCMDKTDLGSLQAVTADTTIVLYMPGDRHRGLARELRGRGLAGQTPCLIVSQASRLEERVQRTILGKLAEAPPLPPPCVVIIGAVGEQAHVCEQPFSFLRGAAGKLAGCLSGAERGQTTS